MSNSTAVTQTTNIVPVQGIFEPEPTFALISLIGPAGTPFYANINPNQSGLTITNSSFTGGTIDDTVIGGTTPAAGTFTNITATTGQILTLPASNSDIATKEYVDLLVSSALKVKASCVYATTGNITLSGLGTQAGGDWPSSLTAGDRILVKDQTATQDNGIYLASSTGWTRSSDLNTWSEAVAAYVFITAGAVNANSSWVSLATASGTIGVTPMPWTQYSAVASYTAGNGLQLSGSIFSVLANGTTIDVSSSGIKLSDLYAGQATITTLGTITTGVWNGSTIDVSHGGTGATSLTGYVKGTGTAALTASSTIPNTDISGLGTMSTQNASNVAITGGSVAVGTLKTLGLTGYLYGNDTGAVTASTTIPNTAITGLGSMSTQNANSVAITGGTITGLTQLGADYLQFNTGATVTPAVGKIWWNGGTTMAVGMTANVTAAVNETQYVYVKASATITKGQVIVQDGSVGASGVLKGRPAPISLSNSQTILGVAAESIALNDFGLVQRFGYLRGFNTTGTPYGETWVDGDALYYNPAYVGGLTNVKPSAPYTKTQVAEVVNASSSGSGEVLVNVIFGSQLGGTDSNVQFGTLNPNDVIVYDSVAQYWKNVAQSTLAVGTATNLAGGGAGYIPYQTGSGTTGFLAAGTPGQVLTSNGASAPTWGSVSAGITISDDTTTNATFYPLFSNATTGSVSTQYVSSTKLQYNPSTGLLTATGFSGSGASLTNLTAGNLSGTIPSAVLGNSSLYIGTTSIALNRASASQSLTGVNIDGTAGGLSATLAVSSGGTGQTSYTDGELLIGNSTGNTLAKSTLTAGSGISITNGSGSITIAATGGGLPTMNIVTGTTQTASASNHYVLTNAAATTLTLPATPSAGDVVWVSVGNGLTTNVVARNGEKIQSLAEDMTLNTPYGAVQFRYVNSTIGWTFT